MPSHVEKDWDLRAQNAHRFGSLHGLNLVSLREDSFRMSAVPSYARACSIYNVGNTFVVIRLLGSILLSLLETHLHIGYSFRDNQYSPHSYQHAPRWCARTWRKFS